MNSHREKQLTTGPSKNGTQVFINITTKQKNTDLKKNLKVKRLMQFLKKLNGNKVKK